MAKPTIGLVSLPNFTELVAIWWLTLIDGPRLMDNRPSVESFKAGLGNPMINFLDSGRSTRNSGLIRQASESASESESESKEN